MAKSEKSASNKSTRKPTANIKIVARISDKVVTTKKATSVSGMWKINKALFAEHPDAILFIKKDGEPFMKLHLATKSNGKTWMVNDIPESRRGHQAPKPVEDTAEDPIVQDEPVQEVHTIDEAEEPAAEETAEVFADAQ